MSSLYLALIRYRMEQAEESLQAARAMFGMGLLRPAINRAYYTMFYAVLALLATEGRGTSKHTGAIALFDMDFINKGTVKRELSAWLHRVFDLRQKSDYREMFQPTQEDAKTALERADAFLAEVRQALSTPDDAASGPGE